jgi:hypothetical protein
MACPSGLLVYCTRSRASAASGTAPCARHRAERCEGAASGVSRSNNKIDRATAAFRADKPTGPFGNRKVDTVARRLFAVVDIDQMPAMIAPSA